MKRARLKRITHQSGFCRRCQAEPRRMFREAVSLGGVAAFGIALPADAQFPEVRADQHITHQANGAIREG